jgi:molybdate transport system substrate-binding protein
MLGPRKLAGALGLMFPLALLLAGCAHDADGSRPLMVFAASSLTEAFTELEQRFEQVEPVEVQLAFSGSQVLRLQIEQGARADLFASADEAHLAALSAQGLAGPAVGFASNQLVLIVPADNPAGIATFADLSRARRLVIGTPAVPVGAYTRDLLAAARRRFGPAFGDLVDGAVVSHEANVRLVRAKVELGEADAAIVYRTDAQASPAVRAIDVPADLSGATPYALASLTGSTHPAAGRFVDFVLSPAGQRILVEHGFGPAP